MTALRMPSSALTLACVPLAAADKFPATGGDIEITPLIHSSVQIEHAGKVIQVDPWSVGDLSRAKPADLILITDDVGHHLDVKAIAEAPQAWRAGRHHRERQEACCRTASCSPTASRRRRGRPRRIDRGLRHQAGRAGASEGRSERLRHHARRQADLPGRRHRVRAGSEGAEEHRRRLHADEHPGRAHDAGRRGGMHEDPQAEGRSTSTTTIRTTRRRATNPEREAGGRSRRHHGRSEPAGVQGRDEGRADRSAFRSVVSVTRRGSAPDPGSVAFRGPYPPRRSQGARHARRRYAATGTEVLVERFPIGA